jgi:hypothetical protein
MLRGVQASARSGYQAMRQWPKRVACSVAVLLAGGVLSVVAAAPASASTSPLTASSPPNFGPTLVGLFKVTNVTVTNTGNSTLEINLNASFNSNGSLEFFPVTAYPTSTSCINANDVSVPIPAHSTCSLGIYFGPTDFGARSTTMNLVDSAGGTFRLQVAGAGVAGYFMAGANGEWTTLGFSDVDLESNGLVLNKPIVGMAATPFGMWLVASDGGVFTAGSAGFFGSTGNVRLAKPMVGMAATPDGKGYWLVASDGGVFTFGDAHFYGSTGNVALAKPIVGMAPSPNGAGYWLVASDGGVFAFNVPFEGSLGGRGINDVIGMAPTTSPLSPALFDLLS